MSVVEVDSVTPESAVVPEAGVDHVPEPLHQLRPVVPVMSPSLERRSLDQAAGRGVTDAGHWVVLYQVNHEIEIIKLSLQLYIVHKALQGSYTSVVKLTRLGVVFEYSRIGRKMASLLEFPDCFQAGSGDGVAIAGQQLFQIEISCDLLQNFLGVLRQIVSRDDPVVLEHGDNWRDSAAQSLHEVGSVVVVTEGVPAVVIVLEQVEQEVEDLGRTNTVSIPETSHGQGNVTLQEIILKITEVILLDDVAG